MADKKGPAKRDDFMARLPRSLKKPLEREADRNSRSVTAEIAVLIREALKARGVDAPAK